MPITGDSCIQRRIAAVVTVEYQSTVESRRRKGAEPANLITQDDYPLLVT